MRLKRKAGQRKNNPVYLVILITEGYFCNDFKQMTRAPDC